MFLCLADDSSITGPMRLKSYYAVAAYNDSKAKFSFAEGAVVQVLQKDASGEWCVNSPVCWHYIGLFNNWCLQV